MITQSELKALLDYNPETGEFTRNGHVLGPRLQLQINKKSYLKHRIAWFYIHGDLPEFIDHINGNRLDNKITNLRPVTKRQNSQNKKIHRDGKLVGCRFNKLLNKWQSGCSIKNKYKSLGYYNTELEAHNTYITYIKENNL